MIELSEFALYSIHEELEEQASFASIQNEARMFDIMDKWRPNTVYLAAAYKHVPLVEYNPVEDIKNNILGNLLASKVAIKTEAINFVLISTDKAVRQTNIMGVSKRFAEMLFDWQ